MAIVSIDVSEVIDLGYDLQAAPDTRVIPAVRRAVARNGMKVTATGQTLAPVDTGALKNSIGVDIDGLAYEAGPTVEHGAYVELGTTGPYPIRNPWGWGDDVTVMHPGIGPQPYMGPAFDRHLPSALEDLASAAGGIF